MGRAAGEAAYKKANDISRGCKVDDIKAETSVLL